MNKFLVSSANSENISLTIKGIAVAVVPIILLVLNNAGVEISQTEIDEIVSVIISLVSMAMVAYGLLRKIYFFVKKIYTTIKRIDSKK